MGLRDSPGPEAGYGDGTFTADGCPVEIYAAMPRDDEAARLIHAVAPRGASVIELGCGTGRICEPLTRLGHTVTGVDSSSAMLDHLVDTRPVLSEIQLLDLPERFDVVVLASTLINTVDDDERTRFLDSAGRHLKPHGVLILERHAPTWQPEEGQVSHLGPVRIQLRNVVRHDRMTLSATVVHRLAEKTAMQDFSTRILDDVTLDSWLARSGFGAAHPIRDDRRWMLVSPVGTA